MILSKLRPGLSSGESKPGNCPQSHLIWGGEPRAAGFPPHSPRVQPFKALKGPWVREGIMLSSADSVLLATCQMTVQQFPHISLNRFYNLDDARHPRLVWGPKASVEKLNKWKTCSRKERKQGGRGRNGKKISAFACYKCCFDHFTEQI